MKFPLEEMESLGLLGCIEDIEITSVNYKDFLLGKRKMSEWISVAERLPERDHEVLVTNGKIVRVACLDVKPGFWEDGYRVYADVSHWQELPAPPKETK